MRMYREVLFFVLCFSSLENLSLEKVIKYNEMEGVLEQRENNIQLALR